MLQKYVSSFISLVDHAFSKTVPFSGYTSPESGEPGNAAAKGAMLSGSL
jgi:hypothetical protein